MNDNKKDVEVVYDKDESRSKDVTDKIKSGLIKGFDFTLKTAKSVYKKTSSNIMFLTKLSFFTIVSTPSKVKVNKIVGGILDEDNNVIYLKKGSILYKDDLVVGSYLKPDDEDTLYEITSINFKSINDYYVKVGSKYQAVKCYTACIKKIK